MNMLSKNTLLFALALLLSQAQASNLSGVSYFDFSYIDGQGGSDSISGGDGEDTIFGSQGQEILKGFVATAL